MNVPRARAIISGLYSEGTVVEKNEEDAQRWATSKKS